MFPRQLCPGSFFRAGSLCRWHRCAVSIAAATFVIIPAIIFLSPAAEADSQSDAVLALRNFVQLLDQQPSNFAQDESADAAIAALASFSERVGVTPPSPTAELPKLAEADNLIDFLRGLNSPSQPSSAPSETSMRSARVDSASDNNVRLGMSVLRRISAGAGRSS